MTTGFHHQPFDAATQLKLEIFRGYIREWLPVFLSGGASYHSVMLFDFFCGPGTDAEGRPGSPLIIADELAAYLNDPTTPKSANIEIILFFNDFNRAHLATLKKRLEEHVIARSCKLSFSCKDFQEAFAEQLPTLNQRDSAALIIMDQYGVKHVTEPVFQALTQCPATDILFFISSSYIRRFITEDAIRKYIPLPEEKIRDVPLTDIHRFICNEYYRRLIPQGDDYFIAPFSIKKEEASNIYGLIFGSSSLLGLEKFLKVCWRQDQITGEANYNIDGDWNWDQGELPFSEFAQTKKQTRFEHELMEYIRTGHRTNRDIYRFTLEAGFVPKHTHSRLRSLQQKERLEIIRRDNGEPARKGSFYISWDEYKKPPVVEYKLKDK
ncbi:MAG: three-Cys-motif partner protein TcmP [Candidatus Sumerlaeota bacterium]|nr:three-Cys-motif partner protein TcmP [Candidatus Sumerlaeota bacterium]